MLEPATVGKRAATVNLSGLARPTHLRYTEGMRTVYLIWIGWFATVGVTEAACTVFDILTRWRGMVVPDSLAMFVYLALAVMSGMMVMWVSRQSRDFQSRTTILMQAWAEQEKALREHLEQTQARSSR